MTHNISNIVMLLGISHNVVFKDSKMKIVPIEIKFQTLYENRHLLTDDVEYDSLLVSNFLNTKIKLLDIVSFINLDDTSKIEIFKNYNTVGYYHIISHHNIHDLYGPEPNCYGCWGWEEYKEYNDNECYDKLDIIDILVIL